MVPNIESSGQSSGSSGQSSGMSSGSSMCLPCVSPVVTCDLLVGFTCDYDPSSNKTFERHLHAECRSLLYPDPTAGTMPGTTVSGNDSTDRLLSSQRGLLAVGGQSVQQPLSLPVTSLSRIYFVSSCLCG